MSAESYFVMNLFCCKLDTRTTYTLNYIYYLRFVSLLPYTFNEVPPRFLSQMQYYPPVI